MAPGSPERAGQQQHLPPQVSLPNGIAQLGELLTCHLAIGCECLDYRAYRAVTVPARFSGDRRDGGLLPNWRKDSPEDYAR